MKLSSERLSASWRGVTVSLGATSAEIRPVLLCGGAGRRLWPLSRPDRPKPLLPLGQETLLAATARRFEGAGFADPWLVAGRDHADAMARAAPRASRVLIESTPRGTAAAIAAAAWLAADEAPGALLLVTPADQRVEDPEALRSAVRDASAAALDGNIVTFGITPDHAATGYGWIAPGEAISAGVRKIARFIEKPHRALAETLLAEGYLWNAGIFLFRAEVVLRELAALAPDVLMPVEQAARGALREGTRWRLDSEPFDRAKLCSFDVAVMERTARAAVMPVSCGWSDVGSWKMARTKRLGAGPVSLRGSPGSFAFSDGPRVAVIDTPDVIVVASGGAVLVSGVDSVDQCGDLEPITEAILDRGDRYEIRRLLLSPGEAMRVPPDGQAIVLEGLIGGASRGEPLGPGSYVASVGSLAVIVDTSKGRSKSK